MTQPTFDINALLETYRESLTPVFRAQQETLKTLERFARYQFAVANDYLDWSLGQAKTVVGPKSVGELVGQQLAINTAFGEKMKARAEEFGQIASETQGTVTKWIAETSAQVNAAKKAA